jgi:hypothetical protein
MASLLSTQEELQPLLDQFIAAGPAEQGRTLDILLFLPLKSDLPEDFLIRSIHFLKQESISKAVSAEESPRVNAVIDRLQRIQVLRLFHEIDDYAMKGCQEDLVPASVVHCIKRLTEMDSCDAVHQLVERWVVWIAQDNLHPLVMTTAEYLRTSKYAVLPLVEHFARELELTDSLKKTVILQKIPTAYQSKVIQYVTTDQTEVGKESSKVVADQYLLEMSHDLLNFWSDQFPEMLGLRDEALIKKWDGKTLADRIFTILFDSERLRRELEVYRQVTSVLVHMSDERFFRDNDSAQAVKAELEKHALPVLIFKLPERQDPETRWHMALMMGYLGGRAAIDPLVQALIGVEGTRATRQKMLSEYYLEPARQHSRESAEILSAVVQDARATMRLVRMLNVIVFGVGIGLLLTGVTVAIFWSDPWARLAGALSGLGGLSGVIIELIRDPLDRIQMTLEKLVKTETVFTNFIWELNLNGAFIQSRYVSNGILTDGEIAHTAERMKNALTQALSEYSLINKKRDPRNNIMNTNSL